MSATLFSIVESPSHPDFSELYIRMAIKEFRFSSIRKAIGGLKTQRPDIVVAEFYYGYGNNYAGVNISNLDVFLYSLQKYSADARIIIMLEKHEKKFVDKLNEIYPLYKTLVSPVSISQMEQALVPWRYFGMFSVRSWLKARYYDAVLAHAERLFLGGWRNELLKDVSGAVLEVGSGTGANAEHYSTAVTSLVLTEPDCYMRKQLRLKLDDCDARHVEVESSAAESLDFPDSSFDYVVSTLVLCSVVDQHRSLTEFRRVLRPGGKLVFLEHVAADYSSNLYHWQKILQPVWRIFSCNCHLARDTEAMILGAGFQIIEIERTRMREMPAVVRPVIKGVALAGINWSGAVQPSDQGAWDQRYRAGPYILLDKETAK